MADRGPVVTAPPPSRPPGGGGGRPRDDRPRADGGSRTTVVVTRPGPDDGGGIGDTPKGPFETQSPHDATPSLNNRLATKSADRELTVHPAEGVVEQQFGGPLKRGGKVIYFRNFGTFVLIDLSLGEGPYATIDTFRWGDKSHSDLGITTEVHLGTAGDTSSTLIAGHEGGVYDQPDNLARVVLRCPVPATTSGQYNPFDFTCFATRGDYSDPDGSISYSLKSPPIAGYYMARLYRPFTQINEADWIASWFTSQTDIGGGEARWEFTLLIDQQDTLDNWLKVVLSYCFAHLRYNNGKLGVYNDEPRSHAMDADALPITFDDYDPVNANTSGEITFVQKGRDEIPTVVIVHGTSVQGSGASTTFLDMSVQIPAPADFDPDTTPWIPLEIFMPGITLISRLTRYGTTLYNLSQIDKDITIPAWENAMLPLQGERVAVRSQRLIGPADAGPNVDEAYTGAEDVAITEIKLGDSPVIRAVPYRTANYGDVVDVPDPPIPPTEPPDPTATPECPASLEALHSAPGEYGMLYVEPPADPAMLIISYFDVRDIFGGGDISVGIINPPADPLFGDGKYHKSFPSLVHYDPVSGTSSVAVRVDSVSFEGNVSAGCSTDSWDITVTPPSSTGAIESAAYTADFADVPDLAYDWKNYSILADVTKVYSTTIDDPTNDFFLIPTGAAQGVICPKMDGEFYCSASLLWEPVPDASGGVRALALAHLGLSGNGGLHTVYVTIDAAGTGYVTGEAIVVTGGSLASGGFALAGSIVASGGAITGISLSSPGIGYASAPSISVATVGGSGATITAHLPITFDFSALNFDCSTGWPASAVGQLWAEDIRMGITDATIPTSNTQTVLMSLKRGSGLLVGVQQGSGDVLSLLTTPDIEGGFAVPFPRTTRVSIFRLPPAAALTPEVIQCPAPE